MLYKKIECNDLTKIIGQPELCALRRGCCDGTGYIYQLVSCKMTITYYEGKSKTVLIPKELQEVEYVSIMGNKLHAYLKGVQGPIIIPLSKVSYICAKEQVKDRIEKLPFEPEDV